MTPKDWIAAAVNDVIEGGDAQEMVRRYLLAALRKHSPFTEGVAYMPVPRCDQCRFWERFDAPAHREGECQKILADPPANNTLAWVTVDYRAAGYSGGLSTRADFGCVQWSAKA